MGRGLWTFLGAAQSTRAQRCRSGPPGRQSKSCALPPLGENVILPAMGPRRERARESEAPLLPFEEPRRDAQPRAHAGERGAPRRVFLGWQRPVLHSAADWIL